MTSRIGRSVPEGGGSPIAGAGQVHILYGSRGGLTASNDQVWNLEKPGVPRQAAAMDGFGAAVR